jgi:hypothetical protein
LPEGGDIVERRGFEDLDAERFDDGTRVGLGHLAGGAGELDTVAVHDEGDGGLVDARGMEAVEGMAGDPAGVAAVAKDPGFGAIGRALAEGLADGGGDHDAEAAAAELGAAGDPRDMAGNVEAAAEGLDDAVGSVQEAEDGERAEK